MFVQNMNKKEIIGLALKIRSAVADLRIEHAYVEVSQYVTVSMGVACTYPDTHNSVKELYEEADQALYMAKENGRNCGMRRKHVRKNEERSWNCDRQLVRYFIWNI